MNMYYGILYESATGEENARSIIQGIVMRYMAEIGTDHPEIKELQKKMLSITKKKKQPETATPAVTPEAPRKSPEKKVIIGAPEEKSKEPEAMKNKIKEQPKKESYINMAKPGSFSWFLREATYEHGVTAGDWLVIMSKPKKGLTAGMSKVYIHYSRPSKESGDQVISTSYKMTNPAGVNTIKMIMQGKTVALEWDPALNKNLFGGRAQKYGKTAHGGQEKDKKQEPTGLYADFAKQVQDIRKEPEQWKPTSPDVAKYGSQPTKPNQ